MNDVRDDSTDLTLGWRLRDDLQVRYWMDEPHPKPGHQTKEDMIQVNPLAMGCHTVIIAQSGAGKSFFLGRLIEELMLNTQARCLVIDPNADFRRIRDTDETHWVPSKIYDRNNNLKGYMPDEKTALEFSTRWQSTTNIRIKGGPDLPENNGQRMRLDWGSVSMDVLADDLAPSLHSELFHCHEFVKAFAQLVTLEQREPIGAQIAEAADSLKLLQGLSIEQRRGYLESRFNKDLIKERVSQTINRGKTNEIVSGVNKWLPAILPFIASASPAVASLLPTATGALQMYLKSHADSIRERIDRSIEAIPQHIDLVVNAPDYISDTVRRYYFGRVNEYINQGVVSKELNAGASDANQPARLEVLDLPSFPDPKTRSLAVSSELAAIWSLARWEWTTAMAEEPDDDPRVPRFIVLDEAHNLIPQDSTGNHTVGALRDQFRRIAAEGRKYGLFLILCTQRPDKIDELTVSECENRAIMRIGSAAVLEKIKSVLALDEDGNVERCLQFQKGRALLAGPWAGNEGRVVLGSGMRRTVEGGRNLQDHWARPLPKKVVRRNAPE